MVKEGLFVDLKNIWGRLSLNEMPVCICIQNINLKVNMINTPLCEMNV